MSLVQKELAKVNFRKDQVATMLYKVDLENQGVAPNSLFFNLTIGRGVIPKVVVQNVKIVTKGIILLTKY